ncbi:MAG: PEP-CTERM sorting domain-containing protein [Pseudomonadota bacterium]|nr:PEP-CTERM sorting domain-containing protein [Pseudomonadota bacterium]MDP1905745.1 PEP-CTERM sorting domain-containing protein [Pseudomonadota bacterium]MDP2352313.1 PEP-CTERM sorting domain-containing protein [Pseudomonadota bacterium]
MDAGTIPGWQTTASDNKIEIWSDSFQGIAAYEGTQFAELNAYEVSTLYQDVTGIASGSLVGFQFAHRGRLGVDVLRLSIIDLGLDSLIGGGDDTTLFSNQYSTGNNAWAFYTSAGEAPIIALGNNVRFAYESISAAGGNPAISNFLDAADFGVGVAVASVPEPSSIALLLLGVMGLGIRGRKLVGTQQA